MTEEIKAVEPPVAAATEVEPIKTEKIESSPPEQPVETAPAPVAAPEEPAAAPAPKPEDKTEETPAPTETAPPEPAPVPARTNAQWGTISSPLLAIYEKLPEIFKKAEHSEIFGVSLIYNDAPAEPNFGTLLILQKFLRANSNDLEKAVKQLTSTLEWRQKKKPLESLNVEHDRAAFDGLGYIQVLDSTGEVLTWNIYGAVKDFKQTFGDLEKFLEWRVALMEAAIVKLNLTTATKPIPDFGKGEDPYQIAQIHDYLSISFLRQDPSVKAASKAAPAIFSDYYPEMLSRKFFVNVPVIMQWLYKATTLVLPAATVKKFKVLSYGKDLAGELSDEVPEVYGGKGVKELKDLGDPVKLTAAPVPEAAPAETEPAPAPAPVPDSAPAATTTTA